MKNRILGKRLLIAETQTELICFDWEHQVFGVKEEITRQEGAELEFNKIRCEAELGIGGSWWNHEVD